MGRFTATALHLTVWLVGGVLYFLFVLPRWWELMGDISHTLGTALRIVTALVFALAAVPVLLTLQRTREPALGTPALALRLRLWSLILHLVAAALIAGAAVTETWVSLDSAGPWLFGVYGAAAAVAILALGAFYLAFVADQPAKPAREKKAKRNLGTFADDEAAGEVDEDSAQESTEPAGDEPADEDTPAEVSTAAEPESGALRNRRPTGKTSHRLRRRDSTPSTD
ncbi:hypothetical protein MANY_35290 [Mycolicibacterium anyangense]|uniref:Transmembrane protein n=1 Tax=Mycolicibacterium anyangense TaxID=1431246 RepID=A0A6N4WE00_9MYCO|nr:hypothetical protein [Mycolicibacterium anyangense]BBZ78192.1 hypothetical protein MANY_35290 [Mycolicibacterium anyangense]